MAVATSFEESNAVLGKPDGMSHEQCESLAVLRTETTGGIPTVVSCWKLTRAELDEVNRTGRIWVSVAGVTMPPIAVDGEKPFGG